MRWARGWKLVLAIGIALIALTVGGFLWWLEDEHDLAPVRAECVRQGFALEAWPVSPDRDAPWTRSLSPAALALRSKTRPVAFSGMRWSSWQLPQPGQPLPADLAAHHAAIPQALIDEIVTLVLATSLEDLARPPQPSAIDELLVERLLVEPPERLEAVYRAACRCISTPADLSGIAAAMRWRLAAGDLRVTGGALRDAGARVWRGIHERALDSARLRWSELAAARPVEWDRLGSAISARAARRGWAEDTLSWLVRTRDIHDPAALVASVGRFSTLWEDRPATSLSPAYGRWMARGYIREHLVYEIYPQLSAAVTAAEFDGAALPIDCFSDDGSPVRAVRDGERLVAAYSMGPDGVDDGGVKIKDFIVRIAPESAPAR
jgi:hypothetical protein